MFCFRCKLYSSNTRYAKLEAEGRRDYRHLETVKIKSLSCVHLNSLFCTFTKYLRTSHRLISFRPLIHLGSALSHALQHVRTSKGDINMKKSFKMYLLQREIRICKRYLIFPKELWSIVCKKKKPLKPGF
jgi:hypothetical protein